MYGGTTRAMDHPGAILAFTYEGEADGPIEPVRMSNKAEPAPTATEAPGGVGGSPASYTAAQAEAGKTAYTAHCAVCHGGNLKNGAYGTPLAGEYFDGKWSGKTARALFEHAKKMPPAKPGSLDDQTYAAVLAYVLQINGAAPGDDPLPTNPDALSELTIP